MPVIGERAVADGLIALHELDGAALGDDRAVGLPSLQVTVSDMIAALERVAAGRPLGRISVVPDPFVAKIVATWPKATDDARARGLDLPETKAWTTLSRPTFKTT